MVSDPVQLGQCDIRELQLAKGAIAAGIQLLIEQWGTTRADMSARCQVSLPDYLPLASLHASGGGLGGLALFATLEQRDR